jgi:hypothetical protein
MRAECLGAGKRRLERRALGVIGQDVQVIGVDERALRRRSKIGRMPHDN